MSDRLTDERLEEMERFALAMDRSDMRALIAEVRELRRVAEAAQRVHRRAERLDYAPDDQWAMRSQEWREAHRALGEALAEWRRVREGGRGVNELLTALRQSIFYTECTYRLYLHYKGRIYDSHSEWARAVVRDAYEQADDEQRVCLREWFPWAFREGEA